MEWAQVVALDFVAYFSFQILFPKIVRIDSVSAVDSYTRRVNKAIDRHHVN